MVSHGSSVEELLTAARRRLGRLTPEQARAAMAAGALLVDIRPHAQRETSGSVPGALVVERNVLEWRFDPRCPARLPQAGSYDLRVIVMCQEGYTSSLAAAALQDLGLRHATDLAGVMGLVLDVVITAASVQDRQGARPLLWNTHRACRHVRLVWAGAGYTGKLATWAASMKMTLQIVSKRHPRAFEVLPRRWVVERTLRLDQQAPPHRPRLRAPARQPRSHDLAVHDRPHDRAPRRSSHWPSPRHAGTDAPWLPANPVTACKS